MAITYGPNLGLLVNANQGEGHYTDFQKCLRGLDGLVQAVVKQVGLNTPPGSPSDGDCYVVGTSPTGVWTSQSAKVARYSSVAAAWEFYTPKQGWSVEDQTTTVRWKYNGSSWVNTLTIGGNLTVSGGVTALTAAAGTNRGFQFLTNGVLRWYALTDSTPESGADAGSAFALLAYTDGGSAIDTPITILRASGGTMTFGGTSARLASFTGDVNVASSKVFKVNSTQVVAARKTGWSTWTGTATRTSFATGSATLQNVAEALKALIDDLHGTAGHGLIGT